jgi:hypothetical protein
MRIIDVDDAHVCCSAGDVSGAAFGDGAMRACGQRAGSALMPELRPGRHRHASILGRAVIATGVH